MEAEGGVFDVGMLFGENEAVQPAQMRQVFDKNGVQLVSQQVWDGMKQLQGKAGELLSQVARLEAANRRLTEELAMEKASNQEKAAIERTRISAAIKSISETCEYPVKPEDHDLLSYPYLNELQVYIGNLRRSHRLKSSEQPSPMTSTAPEPEPPTETGSTGDAQPGNLNPSQSSEVTLALVKTEVSHCDDEHAPETALLAKGVPLVAPIPTENPLVLPSNTGAHTPKPTPTPREDTSSTEMEPGVNLGPPNGNEPSSTNGSRNPSSGSCDDQAQTPPPQVSSSGSVSSMFEEIRPPSQEAPQKLRKRKFKDNEDQTGSGAHLESPVDLQNQSESTRNKFKCQEVGCGQTFLLLGHLNTHRLKVHRLGKVPGQKFGCRYCGRTFATRAGRSSHNAVKCADKQPNQDLQRHGIAPGPASDPHRCTCGRSFLSPAHLNAHIGSPSEY